MCKVTQREIQDLTSIAAIAHAALDHIKPTDSEKQRLIRVHALIRKLSREAV